MPVKIKGLSLTTHGFWRFLPSSQGLPKGAPRPKPVLLGTKDRDEAIRQVMDLRGLSAGEGRGLKEWSAIYREEMLRTGKHRATTATGVKVALSALVEFAGNRNPRWLTRERARDFHAFVQGPTRSPATTHRYIRYARAFFSWLVERRQARENPFLKMKLPAPAQSRRDRFCTAEERDALIAACGHENLRGVLILGFFAGLRINEIVNARHGWFTYTASGGFITVRNRDESFTTKTGKERQIPLHPRVQEWLRANPGQPDDFVVNPVRKSKREKRGAQSLALRWYPREAFRRLVVQCKMPWVTFHTMRHTFGSLNAILGTPEIKIRRWMGITPQTWERHYAGLCPDDRDIDRL